MFSIFCHLRYLTLKIHLKNTRNTFKFIVQRYFSKKYVKYNRFNYVTRIFSERIRPARMNNARTGHKLIAERSWSARIPNTLIKCIYC